ncbi:hypothetical protein FE257_009543 [Aspergillus nanangensis]|uniref:Uncharacterized protein n=1 Tax=Aspergillus nanangensis TaxID=2582783 RepID=A0AAD4CLD7_ASPNN|nr:hypothetical protein FE257_009543 [Aspergillus nanangensis]
MASPTETRFNTLNTLQMNDLGTDRRERLSTEDGRRAPTVHLEDIEASRMSNIPGSKEYRSAKDNQLELKRWSDVHKNIGDTGDLEDLDNLLDGQTHRARLSKELRDDPHYTRHGKDSNYHPSAHARTSSRGAIAKPGQRRNSSPTRKAGLDPALSKYRTRLLEEFGTIRHKSKKTNGKFPKISPELTRKLSSKCSSNASSSEARPTKQNPKPTSQGARPVDKSQSKKAAPPAPTSKPVVTRGKSQPSMPVAVTEGKLEPSSMPVTDSQRPSKSSEPSFTEHSTVEHAPMHHNSEKLTSNQKPSPPSTPRKCSVGTLLDFERNSASPDPPVQSPGCEDLQGLAFHTNIKTEITQLSDKLDNANISPEDAGRLKVLNEKIDALLDTQSTPKSEQESLKIQSNSKSTTKSPFNAAATAFTPNPTPQRNKSLSTANSDTLPIIETTPTRGHLIGDRNLPGQKCELSTSQSGHTLRRVRSSAVAENHPPALTRGRVFSGGLEESRYAN